MIKKNGRSTGLGTVAVDEQRGRFRGLCVFGRLSSLSIGCGITETGMLALMIVRVFVVVSFVIAVGLVIEWEHDGRMLDRQSIGNWDEDRTEPARHAIKEDFDQMLTPRKLCAACTNAEITHRANSIVHQLRTIYTNPRLTSSEEVSRILHFK